MKVMIRAVLLSLLCVCLAARAFGCEAASVHPIFHGNLASTDMTDLALIFRSAQSADPDCVQIASDRLQAKVTAMNGISPSPWRGVMSGVALSFALSSGLILGGRGPQYLPAALDTQLATAANQYRLTLEPNCGFNGTMWTHGNTCLENHAIGTLAAGWRTAYYRLTGRGPWLPDRNSALASWRSTLSEQVACIYNQDKPVDPAWRGPCNGTLAELEADTAGRVELVTVNHGYQNPAYGIGQLVLVAAGFVGLDVAQRPVVFTSVSESHLRMARQYYREGVEKALSTGEFSPNQCRQLLNGTFTAPDRVCHDHQKEAYPLERYRADHFPVWHFFYKHGIPTDLDTAPAQTPDWGFWSWNDSMFARSSFYYPGRYEGYITMGTLWIDPNNRPAMRGNGSYKGGLLRTPGWFLVSSGSNSTPAATGSNTDGQPRAIEETVTIEDLSPDTPLHSGDRIAIRNEDGYYWEATNGGGSTVVARYGHVTNNAKFIVEKWGPTSNEVIAHGDLFSLRTYDDTHYLAAPVGGPLTATATSSVTDTVMRLHRLKTD